MKRNSRATVPSQRAGLALIMMLVALGIVSAIGMSLLRMSLAERHQARREAQAAQAAWLAESGIDLAAALLAKDPGSQGTVWSVPANQLDGRNAARVSIEIGPVKESPMRRQVTVTAEFPHSPTQQPIRSRFVRFVDL